MASETGAMNIERKKSFGIGGAGNIRKYMPMGCCAVSCFAVTVLMVDDREAFGNHLPTEGQCRWDEAVKCLVDDVGVCIAGNEY